MIGENKRSATVAPKISTARFIKRFSGSFNGTLRIFFLQKCLNVLGLPHSQRTFTRSDHQTIRHGIFPFNKSPFPRCFLCKFLQKQLTELSIPHLSLTLRKLGIVSAFPKTFDLDMPPTLFLLEPRNHLAYNEMIIYPTLFFERYSNEHSCY